jgi:hypothetical protein
MKVMMSRREALRNLAFGAGSLLVAGAVRATANEPAKPAANYSGLPHVTPEDPVAIALSYHESASTVDAKKFPIYKPEQKCSNCLQLTGKAGDPWRPCNLFPGKLVNAEGWCKVYVKKQ